jgi:hypothetical protein
MALTQKTLDQQGCGTPNCGHDHTTLHLLPMCHPHGNLKASYNKSTGVLTIICARCSKLVAEVEVAAGSLQ